MAKTDDGAKKRGRPAKTPATSDSTPPSANGNGPATSDAPVGFDAKLWQMADKLRNNISQRTGASDR